MEVHALADNEQTKTYIAWSNGYIFWFTSDRQKDYTHPPLPPKKQTNKNNVLPARSLNSSPFDHEQNILYAWNTV